MGWMSWEIFRCEVDCNAHPTSCIGEKLYTSIADAMHDGGYLAAGYHTVSIDDCWESKDRDANGNLQPNATRFPSGLKHLGDYMHARGINFGIYSDEGTKTCGGYPGSKGFEASDAKQFAEWGVDYLKLDGCYNNQPGYVSGYPAMGSALQGSERDIVYSCSWPAYLGDNETKKPFKAMIDAGCNLWRNWADIQCNFQSLSSIIEHWGTYSIDLQSAAGPGHWNDPDMLLIGNNCITVEEEKTQMAIWSVVAAPLIMGNDLRTVPDSSKDILLNSGAIAIDQDPLGKAGIRTFVSDNYQIWQRELSEGKLAVVLYNTLDNAQNVTLTSKDILKIDFRQIKIYNIFEKSYLPKEYASDSFSITFNVHAHGVAFLRLDNAN